MFAVLFRTSIIAALMGLMFGAVAAGECPLCKAAHKGDMVEVKRLLAAGADVNAVDKGGWSALMFAVFWGRSEVVKILLDADANPNVVSNAGSTALIHSGFFDSNVEVVKMLLDAGAYVDTTDKNGWTALMFAAYRNHAEVAKVLLHAGANPDMKNHAGKTAWDYIKGKKRMEYVFERAIEEWYEKQ